MKKVGKHTLKMDNFITVSETASVVGPKESNGPLKDYFDKCIDDEFFGEKSWEKAECKFVNPDVPQLI